MKVDELLAYHGSDADISQFRPLTHFGSRTAADDRMAYKKIGGNVYEVDLDIKNPAVIKDAAVQHSATQLAFALKDAKIFSQEEMTSVSTVHKLKGNYDANEKVATDNLIKLLKSKGYDGLAYKNRYEDKGHISYVILDPKQAKIVRKIPVEAKKKGKNETL
jgi:hypothetical protein